jgi:hypothetical protein
VEEEPAGFLGFSGVLPLSSICSIASCLLLISASNLHEIALFLSPFITLSINKLVYLTLNNINVVPRIHVMLDMISNYL